MCETRGEKVEEYAYVCICQKRSVCALMMSVCECEQSSLKSPGSCGGIVRTNNLRTSAVCVHACVFMRMDGHLMS